MYGGEPRRAPAPGRAAAPLKVYLLGRFEVVRGDVPIPHQAWRRRRPADLLKLMALTAGRALPRDQAIETLWPDKDPASGANNLHRALYDLRQILGARCVELERGRIRMDPDVWVDVEAFESSARSPEPAGLETAVALYRGDLSPEDRESPWLTRHRDRLRTLMAEAALPIVRAAAGRGDAAVAVPLLRRILDVDPAHEEPQRLLIRLLAESGRRADALRQYDACESALRSRGLGPPSTDLRELRDAVQRGSVGPAHGRPAYDGYRRAARRLLGTSDPGPLRGRTASLLLFESLIEEGSGGLVLLGERGVGKSRLAVEGARIAQEAGAVVVTALFDPVHPRPYGCFADLFSDYLRAGGQGGQDPFADPAAHGAGPAGLTATRLLDGVRAQLTSIGGGRPVYLLIDDLHEADESSANFVHSLARSARALRLMLVATCREDAVHAGTPTQMLLSHLDCERLARGVRVQRLDLAASRQQLGDLLGTAPSDPLAAHFYRLTDGSPFYTEELARAFKESGHVKVPEDPASAVRERAERLGPRAVALLEAAAVAGHHFDFEVVKPASGLTGHEALAALEQLLEAHVVDDDGAGYHFHHSLAREAVQAALPTRRRIVLHRAIADSLEQRALASPGEIEDAAEQLAFHRLSGAQPERAFGHFVTAGHRAAARAGLREASGYFEAAWAVADAAGASGPRRLELLDALGEVQLALADLPGALRTCDAAIGLSDLAGWRPGPEQRARTRRTVAVAHLVGGRLLDAKAQLDAGLADALLGSGDERAELLLLSAQVAWHEGRSHDAFDAARRCAEEAQRVGDPALAARGRDLATIATGGHGEPTLLWLTDPPQTVVDPTPSDVHLVLWENDLLGDRTVSQIEAGVAAFRERAARRGAAGGLALARALEGVLAARAGRLEIAEPALREAQALFRQGEFARGEAFSLDALAALLTARGHLDEALSIAGEGIVIAERATLRRHTLLRLHATLARNRLAAGALYAAEDALREASELAARHGECAVCEGLFRPELIRLAVARGRPDQAEAEADALDALSQRRGGRGLAATARKARARVLAAQGRPAEAVTAFLEAATGWESVGATFEMARALWLAAGVLRGAGTERSPEADALAARAASVLGSGADHDA